MLVLNLTKAGYPDDGDNAIHYRLPIGLAPLPGDDGVPQAILIRSAEGGLMHLRLGATWPELSSQDRQIPFSRGRFRLRLHTPTTDECGHWQPLALDRNATVDCNLAFSPLEMAIARQLNNRGENLVDVEVELTFQGMTPAYPWRVSAEAAVLQAQFTALLGHNPVPWEAVQTAFLELSPDLFTWYPLAPGALPPPSDDALRLIAQQLGPRLFAAAPDGWSLLADGPDLVSLSLQVPTLQHQTLGLRWSWSDFLAAQPDPDRHLVDIQVPAPFEAADLYIVNDLALAPGGLTSLTVDIFTGGPSGLISHEFRLGEPSSARLRFIRETFEELNLRWQVRAAVITAQGPTLVETDLRPGTQLIELTAANVGLRPLRFRAEPEVFSQVKSLEVQIGQRRLTLTPAAPEAWAVGRTLPPTVVVSALLPSGEAVSLGNLAIGPQGLTLGTGELGVGEVVVVTLRAPANLLERAAYLAVQIDSGPWRTLEAGAELTWAVRRQNRFQPPQIAYRTRHVPRSADGRTAVLTAPQAHQGQGELVEVDL
ncbi:hypothetical protein VB780_24600 [Leptolyngbya sp. CCNP1308]|uniref:hypothetical protein n=1 Tax=Leptolyngbya sp. CCNP1308 TaxID=3110255 RepID=UPI002B1EE696|nr:hypothetical protein [Leptolyngbya sp. CCNP1308]MEA5451780.1 hypothetical protein [Leptolyngbya sp. CCNP1308]